MHALIIEDESLIAIAIEDALRGCGFTSFDVAPSADEAIAAAARRCPDLITADVQLRPGCGIAAVETICSAKPIPVLFITGTAGDVRLRVPGHLVEKPFTARGIEDAIKLTLGSTDG